MSPFCEHCGKMFFPFGDTIRSVKFTAAKDVVLVHGTGEPDGINTGKECARVFDAAVESGRWEDFLDGPIRRAFAKAQEENDRLHADHPYDLCPDGGPVPGHATRGGHPMMPTTRKATLILGAGAAMAVAVWVAVPVAVPDIPIIEYLVVAVLFAVAAWLIAGAAR